MTCLAQPTLWVVSGKEKYLASWHRTFIRGNRLVVGGIVEADVGVSSDSTESPF